jgi:hypothetical protein
MIGPLDDDSSVSIEPVVDIHAAVSVVNIGTGPVGASTDHTAVCGMYFMTTGGRRMTGEGSRRRRTSRSTAGAAGAGMRSAKSTARARATRTSGGRTMGAIGRRTMRGIRGGTVSGSATRSTRRRTVGSTRGGTVRSAATRGTTRTVRSLETATRSAAGMSRGRRVVGWRRCLLLLLVTGDANRRVGNSQGEQQTRRSQGSL